MISDRQSFLVLYDYGQGGVWAFVQARSARDIEQRLPDLEIVDDVPGWMDEDELAEIKDKMIFDLDRPHGWLTGPQILVSEVAPIDEEIDRWRRTLC